MRPESAFIGSAPDTLLEDLADAAALEVPDWAHHAIVVDCPREIVSPLRHRTGWPMSSGLHAAFPEGMPDREEERVLSLLLAIASRLHTGVRLADEPGLPTRVIIP